MDEKLSSTVTEGRVTVWTKHFQLGSADENDLDESEYGSVDGWERVHYCDGRQVYYLFRRNASNYVWIKLFRKIVGESENMAEYGAYMDGWEAVQYCDGR